ncbi:MAG: AMP-binding protein [Negativicutes bacterium]|nr:AMP-binding protein [Negativicutes bacterium]
MTLSFVESWTLRHCQIADFRALEAWQQQMLQRQILQAQRSDFYAQGIPPFTTADQLAADPQRFLCIPPRQVARITTLPTSGTTGKPKRLFFSPKDLRQTIEYFSAGMQELMQPGETAALFLPGATQYSVGDLLERAITNLGGQAKAYGFIADPAAAALAAKGADCLAGYPIPLLVLSRAAPQLRPKSLLVTGDYTPAWLLRELEQTWHCRTHPHYGLTESGFGCAVRGQNGPGLQICHPFLRLEIADPDSDRLLAPGEWGEIVLTTLQREAMPLLRYRTGDRGRLLPDIYPYRLAEEQTRLRQEKLWGWLTVHELDRAVFSLPEVKNYRAERQQDHLHLVLDSSLTPQQIQTRIFAALQREFSVEISFGKPDCESAKRRIL